MLLTSWVWGDPANTSPANLPSHPHHHPGYADIKELKESDLRYEAPRTVSNSMASLLESYVGPAGGWHVVARGVGWDGMGAVAGAGVRAHGHVGSSTRVHHSWVPRCRRARSQWGATRSVCAPYMTPACCVPVARRGVRARSVHWCCSWLQVAPSRRSLQVQQLATGCKRPARRSALSAMQYGIVGGVVRGHGTTKAPMPVHCIS